MKQNSERSTDTCIKRTERYKVYAAVKRILPLIFSILMTALFVWFFLYTAPYVKGTEELENPLTNSQMSMMLVWGYVGIIWYGFIRKMRR